MSKAPPFMPMPCCTLGAVPGTIPSGVVVARMRWSISAAVRPALASAAWAASMARPDVVPPMWRSRMPVRSTIHSSLVSRRTAKSALVTTLSGHGDAPAGDADSLHAADPARTAWMHTMPASP